MQRPFYRDAGTPGDTGDGFSGPHPVFPRGGDEGAAPRGSGFFSSVRKETKSTSKGCRP